MTEQMPPNVRTAMIRGRIRESIRLAWRSRNPDQKKVLAYHRYLFSDTRNLLNERETFDALNTIKASGANGVVLWGSSFDLNSRFRISVRFMLKYAHLFNILCVIDENVPSSTNIWTIRSDPSHIRCLREFMRKK